jgi:Rrf2 family protein
MRITAQEEYGLRCLLRVGRHLGEEPLSAQQVAQEEGLSLPYTQKLLRVLAQGGLVEAKRGASGGYVLARPAEAITLGGVIRVLGGLVELEDICERHTGDQHVCCNVGACSIRPVWSYLSEFVIRTFDSIPLALLLREEEEVARRLMELIPHRDSTPMLSTSAEPPESPVSRSHTP